jgi:FAD:protein FMN transferase
MSSHTFRTEAMATTFEVAVDHPDAAYARQAAQEALREAHRLESELSRFIESSDIARANRLAEGQSARIGEACMECLIIAAAATAETGGAFDAAYASDAAPGVPAFSLDPDAHLLTSRCRRLALDLGAIGKGFALDRMAAVLRDWDVDRALLCAGGSTALALDCPVGETCWRIGIGEDTGRIEVPLRRAAVSGSGTAVKGEHLVDPRSAVPARRVLRAYACADTAAASDALSTAFFVMSDDAVAAFCEQHAEVGAGLTLPDGSLRFLGCFPR